MPTVPDEHDGNLLLQGLPEDIETNIFQTTAGLRVGGEWKMKVDRLDFLTAVQALLDGKCEKIMSNRKNTYKFTCLGELNWGGKDKTSPDYREILGDWQLINPIIPTEKVEVKRWLVLDTYGEPMSIFDYKPTCLEKYIVELTGYREVPAKQKVTRQVEIEASVQSSGYLLTQVKDRYFGNFPKCFGKTGKLIFEWEEEK
jgi:hypothetical protein